MFDEESLVTTIFKIINVLIFSGVLAYAFRNYLLPILRDELAEQSHDRVMQAEGLERLIIVHQDLQYLAFEQQRVIERMKINLHRWNIAQQEVAHKMQERQESIKGYLTKKVALQQQYLKNRLLAKEVALLAIDEVEQELAQRYAQAASSASYVSEILVHLKEQA